MTTNRKIHLAGLLGSWGFATTDVDGAHEDAVLAIGANDLYGGGVLYLSVDEARILRHFLGEVLLEHMHVYIEGEKVPVADLRDLGIEGAVAKAHERAAK